MILASRSSRLLGQALDAIIAILPFFGAGFIDSVAPEFAETLGFLWLAAMLFCLSYLFFADALPGGQSFGKRMLGIAVVDERSGRPCSLGQSFARNFALAILGFLDWIFIFGQRHQRLGDKAANTIVVNVERASAGIRYQ